MPGVIDPEGRSLTWTAVYWRYHSRYEHECDSLEGAVSFLEHGEDDGELSSESIIGPNGEVLYDFGELSIWDIAGQLRDAEPEAGERPMADELGS